VSADSCFAGLGHWRLQGVVCAWCLEDMSGCFVHKGGLEVDFWEECRSRMFLARVEHGWSEILALIEADVLVDIDWKALTFGPELVNQQWRDTL
jgi:hypothetical protein